jgi:hypothetical protein
MSLVSTVGDLGVPYRPVRGLSIYIHDLTNKPHMIFAVRLSLLLALLYRLCPGLMLAQAGGGGGATASLSFIFIFILTIKYKHHTKR